MIEKTPQTSAGRPAVKPRPTPGGGKPGLPSVGQGNGTKPAFPGTKPSFGSDGFEPGAIKPGGPHWGGDKLPACPAPRGEAGPKDVQPIGPFKLDASLAEKFLEKFKN